MRPTEHHAKPASTPRIGFFATLRGLFRAQGSGAPSRVLIFTPLMTLAAVFGLLALSAAPALAAAPETPETGKANPATITATTATLEGGVLNPKATTGVEGGEYRYLYNPSPEECNDDLVSEPSGVVTGLPNQPVPAVQLTGLQPNETYSFCLEELKGEEDAIGPIEHFKTLPVKPTFDSYPAPSVRAVEAHVEAAVSPNNETTECHFQYGTVTVTENTVGCEQGNALEGGEQGVGVNLTGLTQDTLYHYRVLLKNATGMTEGPPAEFTTGTPEPPEAKPVTEFTASSATLKGVLNPRLEGIKGTYEFVYERSPTQCDQKNFHSQAPEPAGEAFGAKAEAKSVTVTGLLPGATYTFCLLARNEGGETALSSPVTFTTEALAPTIKSESESATEIGSSSATLNAKIDPDGTPTTYFFEYATEAEYAATKAYGSATPVQNAGSGSESVSVQTLLEGLAPETAYHFRVVVSNVKATSPVPGVDNSFSTFPVGVLGLPDGRVYELVSPLENGDATALMGYLARAAADGSAVAYIGTSSPVGGNGTVHTHAGGRLTGTNTYFAKRSATGGWTAADIQPPGLDSAVYGSFSSDLSVGVLSSEEALTPGGPTGKNESGPSGLYTREEDGSYHLLAENAGYQGSTADGSHILLSDAEGLYDSVGGQLYKVNVLPKGDGLAPGAVFGTPPSYSPDLDNVISSDGSRVFWTDTGTGDVYVRENDARPQSLLNGAGECTVPADACTLAVSAGPATYWTATPDGQYVFYTENGELWRFDTTTDTREALASKGLAGESAGVRGVLGASEDGSYVYFAAAGGLVEGVKAQECIQGNAGTDCNVYVVHEGEAPKFVATVTEADGWGPGGTGSEILVITAQTAGEYGDWSPDIGDRTAYVAADGHELVFESVEHLTGFEGGEGREIYTYDFGSGVSCVSCNPTGASTTHEPQEAHSELPQSQNPTYALRDVSADGDRVFFETNEQLVSQDTNEELALPLYTNGLTNVYEWEREGSDGSCPVKTPARLSGGCIFLLSGGTSADISFFLDASENGDDVFIETRADLVPQDHGDEWEVYDVRAGAPAEPAPPACTGSGCQGVPGAPPIFATPSSVTFNGVGNFPPLPAPVEKVTKKTVKCAKGKKLSHGKCVKQKKQKKSTHRKESK